MAAYSFSIDADIRKVRKGIQPIDRKTPKKSKSEKANEANEEQDREHECEKETKLCQR
jgi:hypothetical protein